jgi:hypothetical protein
LGLGTPHNKSRERETPTHRAKDRENMGNLKTRENMGRQRKIPGSGVTSIRAPIITLLIVAQSSDWWLR